MDVPPVHYARTSDGGSVAYCSVGEGKALVVMAGIPFCHVSLRLTISAGDQRAAELLASLGRRWIQFDPRGMGSSSARDSFSLDGLVADLEAVVDKLGLDEFDLMASSYSCPVAVEYSVRHPQRVSHLVLLYPFLRGSALDTPAMRAVRALRGQDWKVYTDAVMHILFGRSRTVDADVQSRILQESITPEGARQVFEMVDQFDITAQAANVETPTLVVSEPEGHIPLAEVRAVAAAMPSGQSVVVESVEEGMLAVGRFLGILDATATATRAPDPPSAFRTVLFTDLVGHTEMMSRLGDEKGREVLREHEAITREVLKANGGTEVKTMGDGFMASFGSVTKAVECAVALQRAFEEWNTDVGARHASPLRVRVGLNAGEPIEEDGDLFGATVILASRIAARADGGEILVADTVRGLCSGKGFLFSDRGEFVAKGFEEPVRVYEVSWRG
jgi:class 3 adenylate cyclase/pimeloyl-ACP methyl ester carboxylesterase